MAGVVGGAITKAGYGAIAGGLINKAAGGSFTQGALVGAATGAIAGGIGGAFQGAGAAAEAGRGASALNTQPAGVVGEGFLTQAPEPGILTSLLNQPVSGGGGGGILAGIKDVGGALTPWAPIIQGVGGGILRGTSAKAQVDAAEKRRLDEEAAQEKWRKDTFNVNWDAPGVAPRTQSLFERVDGELRVRRATKCRSCHLAKGRHLPGHYGW